MYLQVCSGWLLLEVLDVLAPGSVHWNRASKPPFKAGMVGRLKAMENCSQVLSVATDTLGLQLVSMR
jgi:plastin-1